MTPPNVELAHLYALRAHIEALILAAEARMADVDAPRRVDPGACPTCQTPAEMLRDTSTLDGVQRRMCPTCRSEWEL